MNFLPRTPTQFLWTMKYLFEKYQLVTHLQDLFDIDVNTVVYAEVVENLDNGLTYKGEKFRNQSSLLMQGFLKKLFR